MQYFCDNWDDLLYGIQSEYIIAGMWNYGDGATGEVDDMGMGCLGRVYLSDVGGKEQHRGWESEEDIWEGMGAV